MTDNRFNDAPVDTTRFRQAMWFYVHRVYGLIRDDFNYKNVCIYILI